MAKSMYVHTYYIHAYNFKLETKKLVLRVGLGIADHPHWLT